jgi:hypothetical protein
MPVQRKIRRLEFRSIIKVIEGKIVIATNATFKTIFCGVLFKVSCYM